jgi:hypothetical protein
MQNHTRLGYQSKQIRSPPEADFCLGPKQYQILVMLGAFAMLDNKAYGSRRMQVTVAQRTSRKAGEERTGTKGMGLEPTLDQTSNAVDTCFDDDNVAHTSPFKRYCDHTCTEALHTGKRYRACQYMINARAAPCFWGISICLKLPEVKTRRNSHCLLSLGLRHQ